MRAAVRKVMTEAENQCLNRVAILALLAGALFD